MVLGDEVLLISIFGKCPRCEKMDILVIINGLKPMCRVCLKTAADIIKGR